jgi:alkanesulfonate monooxygenase SsuD/methylene tetrahydromethanopterin reductase-like flavin-dependent oxidoreductase (luciferase family)
MAVQFGVHIGAQNATVDELRTLWKWLDANGMDWISLWDHLYEAPPAGGTQPHFEAFSMLGALAVDTTHARLGCLVFCSQYRNIGLLMKGAISVDHLSGGRFELGMGSGWHEQEALAFGIDFPSQGQRFKVLEGQMQAVNKWRKGERVTQSSPSVELRDASMVPGIMGKMPLWIGGLGPKQTLRMAGAYADGWNAAYASPAQYRELNGILDDFGFWKRALSECEIDALYLGVQCGLGLNNLNNPKSNEVVRIIDLMGRETEFKPNTPLIYIYSDGSTERVFHSE